VSEAWVRPLAATIVGALALGLASCARPVGVEPAPSASDPVCAELLQRLPEELVDEPRRSTTSQSSRAWGGEEPIVLRCGVTPPGPTTDPCVTIPDTSGENPVDWVANPDTSNGLRVFTSYGRTPAVEVVVPARYPGDAVLAELAGAVAPLPQDGECL